MTHAQNSMTHGQAVPAVAMAHGDRRARFAALAARQSLAVGLPVQLGGCHFYTVEPGWQKDVFNGDRKAKLVETAWDLEDALEETEIDTVYIPLASTLTQATAKRICARHTQSKTVFFEIEHTPFNLRESSENDHE